MKLRSRIKLWYLSQVEYVKLSMMTPEEKEKYIIERAKRTREAIISLVPMMMATSILFEVLKHIKPEPVEKKTFAQKLRSRVVLLLRDISDKIEGDDEYEM